MAEAKYEAGRDSLLVTHLANVRYLTGFTGTSGCVLMTPRKRLFFTDSRYQIQAARQVKGYDVQVVKGGLLEGMVQHVKSHRLKLGALGFEGAYLSHRQQVQLKRLLKGVKLLDLSGMIESQRMKKKRREVNRIRQAALIADEALQKLSRLKVVGKTEREIAWQLEVWLREAGSGPLPFEIIVASGPRSAMPHGVASDRIIKEKELVVVDLGASVDGYCSDMTRTFATGELTSKQKEIYQVVKQAQEQAMQSAKPGVSCATIDRLARDHINAAGYGEAFGHSTGHGVGLEAHEAPSLWAKSLQLLERGMVVTVEPGIYLNRIGGVRIEDTVLVGPYPQALTVFTKELVTLR